MWPRLSKNSQLSQKSTYYLYESDSGSLFDLHTLHKPISKDHMVDDRFHIRILGRSLDSRGISALHDWRRFIFKLGLLRFEDTKIFYASEVMSHGKHHNI